MKPAFLLVVLVGIVLCSSAHTSSLILALRATPQGASLSPEANHLRVPGQQAALKRVLVTGGRSGIGYGIVLNALKHPAAGTGPRFHLIISSTDRPGAEAVIQDLKSQFNDASLSFLELDLKDEGSVKQAVDMLKKDGGIDILVNNAGGYENDPESQMDMHYYRTKTFTEALIAKSVITQNGKIIFIMGRLATFRNLEELNPEAFSILNRYRKDLTFTELDSVYRQYINDLHDPDLEKHNRWLHENGYAMHVLERIYAYLLSRSPAILKRNIQVYASNPGWVRTGLDRSDENKDAPLSIEEGGRATYYLMTLKDDIDLAIQGEFFSPDNEVVA